MKNVSDNEKYRSAFNKLAENTFGLNFEGWYQNGFWEDNYIPYTLFDGEKAVANVSVNRCDFLLDGVLHHYHQLGTVMTDPEYRGQGLSRRIMEEIQSDFAGESDGFFLFANDSVLDFYPRFGFQKADEYCYQKTVEQKGQSELKAVPMQSKEDFAVMVDIIDKSVALGRMTMKHNAGLIMFYLSQFMSECVYRIDRLNCFIVAEIEEDTATIYEVFSEREVNLNEVIGAFGEEVKQVKFLFTPLMPENYKKELVMTDDTTLFLKGNIVDDLDGKDLMFPALSHA